jgi:hypothetical protein|tara:strand:- start:28655 stop:28954 length:300 start_codon:yes stop_codon:yes gene_type:complete
MIAEILEHKRELLASKSGDSWVMPFYLDGWRHCEISIGRKKGRVKPISIGSGGAKNYSARKLKEELKKTYWAAARSDASFEAWARGRKKRSNNWEDKYK